MNSLGTRHPSGEDLLFFVDGEMDTPASERIRGHLKACWQCRHELEQIERTIRDCVQYHDIVAETCLPSPPQPWFDIFPRLDKIDEQQTRQRWMSRLLEPFAAVIRQPRRWIPALATIALLAVVVEQLREAPSVQAAELLRKAVVAESRPQMVRHIRIRTRTGHFMRTVGQPGARISPVAESSIELAPLFHAAHFDWEDPLSAKSYAVWRDQLADKHDEVTQRQDFYQLRTTTDSGELAQATLKLSSTDLHAMEGTLQFRNHEWVEMSEVAEPATPALGALHEPAGGAAIVPHGSVPARPTAAQPVAATAGDELAVMAVLHRLGADLGDPVEVSRAQGEVLVTGAGIGIERQQQIRDQLRTMPRVAVRFATESAGATAVIGEPTPSISVRPGTGPLQADLEKRLGGRAAFEQFADEMVDTTDHFMSRAHALRRLAQRFPPEVESQMTSDQRLLLDRLREDHALALLKEVSTAAARLHVVLPMTPVELPPTQTSGEWQQETEQLFADARRAETTLVALLGASQDQAQPLDLPAQTAAALAQFQKRAENYQRLAIRP